MPRTARAKSPTGYYHAVSRGVNRQAIFCDDADKEFFLKLLFTRLPLHGCTAVAFCLMTNHTHILLHDPGASMSLAIRDINQIHAQRFNEKYSRCGHLFQGRFWSEPIKSEGHLYSAIKYIHNNPVAKNMCKEATDYEWSSARSYAGEIGYLDAAKISHLLGEPDLSKLLETPIENDFLDVRELITDEEIVAALCAQLGSADPLAIHALPTHRRDEVFKWLVDEGVSTRDIARLTNYSQSTVWRSVN